MHALPLTSVRSLCGGATAIRGATRTPRRAPRALPGNAVRAFTEPNGAAEGEMGHEAVASMLGTTKTYLNMYVTEDMRLLNEIASEDLRVHADGATLRQTTASRAQASRELGTFFARHNVLGFNFISTAVDAERGEVFGLVQFEGDELDDLSASFPHMEAPGFTRIGLEKLVFEEDRKTIKDIYFFRQLTPDETYGVVRERLVPQEKLLTDDPMLHYRNESLTMEQKTAMVEAAQVYLGCWTSGDFGEIEQVMDENIHFVEGRGLWLDREIWGAEAYVLGVINAYKHMYDIQVTPISFAPAINHAQVFVHYKLNVVERSTSERAEVDVLELLCFDKDAKITGIINMREPLPWDAKHYIK